MYWINQTTNDFHKSSITKQHIWNASNLWISMSICCFKLHRRVSLFISLLKSLEVGLVFLWILVSLTIIFTFQSFLEHIPILAFIPFYLIVSLAFRLSRSSIWKIKILRNLIVKNYQEYLLNIWSFILVPKCICSLDNLAILPCNVVDLNYIKITIY